MHGDGVSGDGNQLQVELVPRRPSPLSRPSRPHPRLEIHLELEYLAYTQEVTSKVLGVEEEEGGFASELVRGEENLLVANQAGADKGRHLLTRQHLEDKF